MASNQWMSHQKLYSILLLSLRWLDDKCSLNKLLGLASSEVFSFRIILYGAFSGEEMLETGLSCADWSFLDIFPSSIFLGWLLSTAVSAEKRSVPCVTACDAWSSSLDCFSTIRRRESQAFFLARVNLFLFLLFAFPASTICEQIIQKKLIS